MSNLVSRLVRPLLLATLIGGCSAAPKPEVHELRPVASEFSVAAHGLSPALAALGMQVAQTSPAANAITVTAVTPEGVSVQVTLRPSGASASSLDVQGDAEQQALAQVATRLAEALAKQLAQQVAEPHAEESLRQLGYVSSVAEPPAEESLRQLGYVSDDTEPSGRGK